jgi:hypothetical protein
LLPHPRTPSVGVNRVSANVMSTGPEAFVVEFSVTSEDGILLPQETDAVRTDGLWQATCFEVFFHSGGTAYSEFNLSPSFAWAAYEFARYREGMTEPQLAFDPQIEISDREDQRHFFLFAELPLIDGYADRLSLSAVIEEKDGTKSYWALRHPPGQPDFHHRDCFALQLSPPDAP